MRISDVTCPHCGAVYQLAVSERLQASPGRFACTVCGESVTSWEDRQLRVFRLIDQPIGEAQLYMESKVLPFV